MTGPAVELEGGAEEFTGNVLVLLDVDDPGAGLEVLSDRAGVRTSDASAPAEIAEALAGESGVWLPELGVAVVPADPDQRASLRAAAADSPLVLAVEPERVVYAIERSAEYLRGYRAGVNGLVDALLRDGDGDGEGPKPGAVAVTEDEFTWGLQAVLVPDTTFTGAGVKVAVLDTGLDLEHRDFTDRDLTWASFIDGEPVQDGHGHGTHCIGTACGPTVPSTLPRYGVACDALVHAGKVLSNEGSGTDGQILGGINWAVSEGCRVVSMSLGGAVSVGTPFSRVFETVARRALARGTIIVAAAGNDSRRPDLVRPVSHPANCPSILAVAALDEQLGVAPFSNAGLNPEGGQIDIAAPGVNVLSSWPEPTGYRRLRGTSMATPHVAGILALLAEATPEATAAELKADLLARAARLPLPSTDVGVGLARALVPGA